MFLVIRGLREEPVSKNGRKTRGDLGREISSSPRLENHSWARKGLHLGLDKRTLNLLGRASFNGSV
jgi:hypothetical protein